MKKYIKYISMLAGAMLLGGTLTACVDDLKVDETGGPDVLAVEEDEYAMGVVLSLGQLTGSSTRGQIGGPLGNLAGGSGEGLKDIEEYVNTENLYILFFNIDGTFLFQINKPVAIPIGQSALGNDSQWFIKIPVKDINENLIHYIEENPFKIAVLANWTFDSDINLGSNLGGWDEFKFNEPIDSEGNLVYDEYGKLKGDHISLLAHAQRDNSYENKTLHGYDHLVYRTESGPHMGPYTEWVANYHKSIDEAESDIRSYFDVEKNLYQNPDNFFYDENGVPTALDHFNTKYNNMWHLWNFGGNDVSNYDVSWTPNSGIQQAWLKLNQEAKDKILEENLYYFYYLTSIYSNFLMANSPFVNYDSPVVKPLPPIPFPDDNNSNILTLKWQMKNYSDLELVMYNFTKGGPSTFGIIPNYKNGIPGYSEMEALFIEWNIQVIENLLKDEDIAKNHPDLIGIDLRGKTLEELETLLRPESWTDEEEQRFMEELYKIMMEYQIKMINSYNGFVICWPNITDSDNSNGNPLNLTGTVDEPGITSGSWGPAIPSASPTYIHFKAHADGYVRVNYKARGGAKLYAHVGLNNTPANNASGYQKDNKSNRYLVNEEGYLVKEGSSDKEICDIPFNPKDIYLYMVIDPEYKNENPDYETVVPDEKGGIPSTTIPSGPMVEIYGIEYIESRHLYDVDRRAILPSKDYPIPMYGIQDFDPIGEYWEPGVLFNLSQYNNAQKEGYNYRRISLLRSVSRVEVKLKKSDFKQKPSHVYLRSTNRSSRITPVDFFTPTDIIWNGFNPSDPNDVRRLQNYIDAGNLNEQNIIKSTPGVIQEEKNIMQYGPIYIGSDTQQSGDKLTEYRRTTAWPFGIWEHQWNWDWNRGKGYVEDFETYQVGQTRAYTGQTVPEYPRIFHTRISRSDYSHFAEVDDPDYWHYIIYIPEKNITDADNPGDISDRPKIIHVELRFNGGPEGSYDNDDPENIVDNFDDNLAYRLYFTEGGRANLGGYEWNGRESWDKYEYDLDIVKQHWPILRNHVYTFTVNGGLNNNGSIDFKVSAPDQRTVNWDFY